MKSSNDSAERLEKWCSVLEKSYADCARSTQTSNAKLTELSTLLEKLLQQIAGFEERLSRLEQRESSNATSEEIRALRVDLAEKAACERQILELFARLLPILQPPLAPRSTPKEAQSAPSAPTPMNPR